MNDAAGSDDAGERVSRYTVREVSYRVHRDPGMPRRGAQINSPELAASLVRTVFSGLPDDDRERLVVILLDTRNRYMGHHIVSVGTVNASLSHPRETFRTAILSGAVAILLAHNHPSGDPTPSEEDREITQRMVAAGEILGIRVLDSIVISDGTRQCFSVQFGQQA